MTRPPESSTARLYQHGRVGANGWFADLCHRHGLEPLPARLAGELQAGMVVFTVNGTPFKITKVKRNKVSITITREDDWIECILNDIQISFVAEEKT